MSPLRNHERDTRRGTESLVEDHLAEALGADDSAEKDYHIRSALQAYMIDD